MKGDLKKEPLGDASSSTPASRPVNATLPDAQAVGTIRNDDPDPQISIGDLQVPEGSPSRHDAGRLPGHAVEPELDHASP